MKLTKSFVEEIRELIASARATARKGVDLVQVHTNFEIGRLIVDQEQQGKDRAEYGKEILKELADRLTADFGRTFSLSNLKSMRQFYLQNESRIGQTASGQLSDLRSPNGELLGHGKSQSLTDQSAILQSLIAKFSPPPNGTRLGKKQCIKCWCTAFRRRSAVLRPAKAGTPALILVPFSPPRKSQSMSAQAVNPPISQSQTGKFSAATVRLFRLKDVNYFDREEKLDDENLTIGLFLCKQKNEALVEITLPKDANIHAHEYQLYLPSKQELQSKLVEWVRDEESNDE